MSDNGHNEFGFVWVVMPEEWGIDPEPYVFNTEKAAEEFAKRHGGWVSEEPVLDASFNADPTLRTTLASDHPELD